MVDQEQMTDLIFSEKKMSDNYSIWAGECTSPKLRDTFLTLLNRSHRAQTDLFAAAQRKGWYKQVPQAQPDSVRQAYRQFAAQAPTAQAPVSQSPISQIPISHSYY